MPDRGIDIGVEVSGADRGRQDLDKVRDGVSGVGRETGSASGPSSRLSRTWESLRGTAGRLVGSLIGVGGLIAAIRLTIQAMRQGEEQSRSFANAIRDLIFLSQDFNQTEIDFVNRQSVIGARDPSEVAKAFATFKSQTANLSDEERFSTFEQVIESGRTTSGSLEAIGTLFSSILNLAPDTDASQLQNLVRQTQVEATETDVTKIAGALAQVLGPGLQAGLSLGEIGGLTAFAGSQAGGNISTGAVGARNILLALLGRGTPESRKILKERGITSDDDFFSALEKLQGLSVEEQETLQGITLEEQAQRSGLTLAQLEAIGGKENASILSGLVTNQAKLRQTVGRTTAAFESPGDLTAEAIENIRAQSELFREDEELRRVEAVRTIGLIDPDNIRRKRRRLSIEAAGREEGLPEAQIAIQKTLFDLFELFGLPDAKGFTSSANRFEGGVVTESTSAPTVINNGTINHYNGRDPAGDREAVQRGGRR